NLKLSALVAAILLCVAFESTTGVFAQRRMGRPPSGRELEGTAILPAGTSVIPDGAVLIIEMDTALDSGTAQVSDRFLARIATPVIDEGGRTLLQEGTIVEGHVTSVKKAKWGHRAGELGLSFDFIQFGDGRSIPLRGTIVKAENRIDDEGELRAKSAAKRDVLVTTGGAVAGAGVGMITGASILAGGGAGAAAGLTIVMLIKGKNVNIDPGERFNLQLVQPLSLTSAGYYGQRTGTGIRPTQAGSFRTPIQLQPRVRTGTGIPRTNTGIYTGLGSSGDPNSVRTMWARVPVSNVRAVRDRDGMLRVQVTAETQTSGWRIYTNHEVQPGDTLDIRLMGIPPSTYGARQTSYPSASEICVDDRNNAIRRIVVHGLNGDRYLTIGSGATTAQLDPYSRNSPSNQQPFRSNSQTGSPGFGSGPSDGSGIPSFTPSPGRSTSSFSQLASQTANQIEILRSNYAAAVRGWINDRDGTIEPLGERTITTDERQLFETLTSMHTSARTLSAPSLDANNRLRSAQRLQGDTQTAQAMWRRVQQTSGGFISQDLNRQWQNVQNNLSTLLNAASR
ncbi:MAG: hypothetical protein ACREAB_06085, partial [Blastocatellia bacterium]